MLYAGARVWFDGGTVSGHEGDRTGCGLLGGVSSTQAPLCFDGVWHTAGGSILCSPSWGVNRFCYGGLGLVLKQRKAHEGVCWAVVALSIVMRVGHAQWERTGGRQARTCVGDGGWRTVCKRFGRAHARRERCAGRRMHGWAGADV